MNLATTETATEPVTATSTAELIAALDGRPFYIDKHAHVPGDTLPQELWNGIMTESALMMVVRKTTEQGCPPGFYLWMLCEVLERRLPVPDYMLIDAQFNERRRAANEPSREGDNPEGFDEKNRYLTFGTYLYYEHFPDRCLIDDEQRADLADRFDQLTRDGYRVPALEKVLTPA